MYIYIYVLYSVMLNQPRESKVAGSGFRGAECLGFRLRIWKIGMQLAREDRPWSVSLKSFFVQNWGYFGRMLEVDPC